MRYKFSIVDVFSAKPFGGNQLAVLPHAEGLSAETMQAVAREFNFAESTFVLPATDPTHTCRVRIFTPKAEMPFAGHPTIGTACVLARGNLGATGQRDLVFAEGIGPVHVSVKDDGGTLRGMLTLHTKAEQSAFAGPTSALADMLSLSPTDIVEGFFASVGLPFCFAHLAGRDAVDRAILDRPAWSKVLAKAPSSAVFVFAGHPANGGELYARMFAPALGVEEDPATGSASAALVGAMAARDALADGAFTLSILQGVAMGRRSEIAAIARKAKGEVTSISVAGATAFVAEGEIDLPSHAAGA